MSVSPFLLLWFILALGCTLAGVVLTQRRISKSLVAQPLVRRLAHSEQERQKTVCARCAQPLEADERFCGFCGLRRRGQMGRSVEVGERRLSI
jgi:uncharacterized paraquat-inducible protein A